MSQRPPRVYCVVLHMLGKNRTVLIRANTRNSAKRYALLGLGKGVSVVSVEYVPAGERGEA